MVFRSPYPDVRIPEQPFSDFVFQDARLWPDAPAFIDGPSGRTLTFAEAAHGARRVAAAFAARGFKQGDVLAISSPNVPEYGVAFHGAIMAGGAVTTVNPLYTADELAFQLNDSGARYVLTTPTFLDKAREAVAKANVRELFVFGEAVGATPFAELLESEGPPPKISISLRDEVAALPYSSGTLGRPKGVMLTHYNLTALIEQISAVLPQRRGHRVLGVLPFFHIFGLQVLLNHSLRHGVTCVTMPRFELASFLQYIQDYRITHLFLVPPLVVALAKQPLVDQYDLSSVEYILSGAAPLDGVVQRAVEARLGATVVQGYGMTETSLAIALGPQNTPQTKSGAAGRIIPNLEARVIDPITGAELGPNERGELLVRGPNIMRGYHNNPDATRSTIDPECWLHTGDIGYVDADRYVFVVDRLKELIKYKGMQVAPAELEGVLLTHPAVADAAVIGIPDEEAGEAPKAFVVLKEQIEPDALMNYVAGRVAPHKKIRHVEVVDSIPKTPSGKVLRRVLQERERAINASESRAGVRRNRISHAPRQ
jgi:acyl-CoA synthetase (AMP-forming)/AMP-acid ligase II